MTNRQICTALAALVMMTAGSAAIAQDITVSGPHDRVVGRALYGADIVEHSASVPVSLRDLALDTTAGWSVMERRVGAASRLACDTIRQQNPIGLRGDRRSCEAGARSAAIARIRQAATTSP